MIETPSPLRRYTKVRTTSGRRGRDVAVEANARLTAATGLLLVGLLLAEGLTVVAIGPLVSWHIGIGLALIPPIALKLGSTLWRFSRYYLGDARYRRAGPPRPVLRALGPVVVVTTVAVMASGVALWLSGPRARFLLEVHKASFVLWFGAMTVHVLAHLLRATRLAGADLEGARRARRAVPGPRLRQGLVLASAVAGVVLGLATKGLATGWAVWVHAAH